MQGILKLLGYETNKNKRYFLITSHGQTASMWLAAVLNRIPQVFCSHGYTYPPQAADLDELSNNEWALRQACFDRFQHLSLSNYFQELKSASDLPVIGNVLAFYLSRLFSKGGTPAKTKRFLKRKNIVVANMVRHPVTRLTSTLKTWSNDESDVVPDFIQHDFNTRCHLMRLFLRKNHNVDFSINKNKAFLVALLAMEDISNDVKLANLHNIQNLKYEDITTDKQAFKKLIDLVTGQMELAYDHVDDLFASKKINAHNNTGISEAHKQYQSWEPWQQDAFKFTMERTDLLKTYHETGYDFSFVK